MPRWIFALALLVGCARARPESFETSDAEVRQAPATVAEAAPTLSGYPWLIDLGADVGVVSVPLGAREPRPIMVALHGGGDRPAWACGEWRAITNAYPFIVCPRGGTGAGYGWSAPADTKTRIARATTATTAIFDPWIRKGVPTVIAGFSMGATQAALLATADPSTYPRVAISESAYAPAPALAFARTWKGARALFSCTTIGCEATYRNAARTTAARGNPARLNIAGTNRHGIWDTVMSSISRDWPWFVDGAEGWEAYTPAQSDAALPGRTEDFGP